MQFHHYTHANKNMHVCVCKVTSVVSNSLHPMNHSPSGSSVHEILQARILGWVAMPSSKESSQPRDHTYVFWVSNLGMQVLYH